MRQRTVKYTIRLTEEERRWLTVLKSKYRINPADFIRDAIVDKMRIEVPKIRESNKIKLPF